MTHTPEPGVQKTIWRYELPIQDIVELTMPIGAQVLAVQKRDEYRKRIDLWALGSPDLKAFEKRTFRVIGTGNPVPAVPLRYVGTVQIEYGTLVFHVFEEVRNGVARES